VLVNNKKEMVGNRIGGVVAAELRARGWGKIVSLGMSHTLSSLIEVIGYDWWTEKKGKIYKMEELTLFPSRLISIHSTESSLKGSFYRFERRLRDTAIGTESGRMG